jgi:hypothetical protein
MIVVPIVDNIDIADVVDERGYCVLVLDFSTQSFNQKKGCFLFGNQLCVV